MVVRHKGLKGFFIPVALYAVAFAVAGFFISQAQQGQRGLEAKQELRQQELRILAELDKLKIERGDWERKVAMFRIDALDRDLLDERVRRVISRVHRHDVVILAR
jgi:hypothetical protein